MCVEDGVGHFVCVCVCVEDGVGHFVCVWKMV